MQADGLRALVSNLASAANALAALGAGLDAYVAQEPLEPRLRPHIEAVLALLGVDSLHEVSTSELRSILGEIRTFTLTNGKLLFADSRRAGWTHRERSILEAAGEVSLTLPQVLKTRIVPELEGLAERLNGPNAAFLDVGVGAAVMAVEMARSWPSLQVVGIEPWAPALAIARERVQAEGLSARIHLREQSGEQLQDIETFDLAWVPGVFVGEGAISQLLQRVQRALRPGGWLLLPILGVGNDPLARALARLRCAMFGGLVMDGASVEALLREHGFVQLHALQSSPTAVTAMFAGRRGSEPEPRFHSANFDSSRR